MLESTTTATTGIESGLCEGNVFAMTIEGSEGQPEDWRCVVGQDGVKASNVGGWHSRQRGPISIHYTRAHVDVVVVLSVP
jgi:hypothetical protein